MALICKTEEFLMSLMSNVNLLYLYKHNLNYDYFFFELVKHISVKNNGGKKCKSN